MSKEQLDAVKDQLLSEDNADLRQKVFSAYLEEPESGANMIITFATDKGLKLDTTPSEVIDYLESLDGDDVDIEMTPEILASVSGGTGWKKLAGAERKNPERGLLNLFTAFDNGYDPMRDR